MPDRSLRPTDLTRYRRALLRQFVVRNGAQCQRFVEALGFCYAFTAGPGDIPGLFDVLGTRSVYRMWSWAWQWKDELATQRRLFYGRVLRRKPTYISLTYLPLFYALSGTVGEPDDYLIAFRAGALSLLAREVYEEIERAGPVNTWHLRRRFIGSRGSGSRLHRALDELQSRFLIAKVAEMEGRGNYSFIWDLFGRWMPDVSAQAAEIRSEEAAGAVLRGYLRIVGAARPRQVEDLFRWPPPLMASAAERAGAFEVILDGPGGAERELLWTLPGLLREGRPGGARPVTPSRRSGPAR
ncbi:MAG TPA: crosslink repair DNA glycosylase YcaQ family protein [bacterium]|nr:crosslink repair DNA glycosylase YcaQ family protein [bacterium]